MKNYRRTIIYSIIASVVLYLAFSIYADIDKVIDALSKFSILLIPVILGLVFANYIFRFFKWHYYLGLIEVKIGVMDSFLIFLSGFMLSVTPGKMGEVLKSFLLKERIGVSVSKTAPVIFAERVTDMTALIIIALAGALSFNYGREFAIGALIAFTILITIISNRGLALPLVHILGRVGFLKRFLPHFIELYESAYTLLKPKPMILMTLFSLISWFFECYAYYLILHELSVDVSLFRASFYYSFATVAGALSFLPGGLGATDALFTLFIQSLNKPEAIAVSSTILIRVATLWFAVIVGLGAFWFYQRKQGKIDLNILNKTEVN
ncbi:MAG: flippase-like domain-containing protein [Ignavibacteriales bacterium]|nr:flippase-like domain-containing protein [Ignavibacteriales bacterium]